MKQRTRDKQPEKDENPAIKKRPGMEKYRSPFKLNKGLYNN